MEKYYLGLDIGTNSVGWAVTDPSYRLERFHKKDMWGIRLFEQADTAADRRVKRTNRRRLQRRHQRIQLLQELFAEEMASPEVSKTLAQEVGAKVETIYTIESKEDDKTYLERMDDNLTKILGSLQ